MAVISKKSNLHLWNPKWDVPLVGFIQNSIQHLERFASGVEDSVTLMPIIDNVLGDHARASVKDLDKN